MTTTTGSNTFITNEGLKHLGERLGELVSCSKELKFLVGFFYFSGIRQLYEKLKEHKDQIVMKVLVGLDVDTTLNKIVEIGRSPSNRKESLEQFIQSCKKAFSSEEVDNREFYEQVDFFIQLLQEDRLVIRKTRHPNHSKLYIFKIKEPHELIRSSIFITGSSNLTYPGLHGQGEFNVEISDFGTTEAEQFFEDLWKDAYPLSENPEYKERIIKVLKGETIIAPITPFEAYAYILKSYLDANSMEEVDLEKLQEIMSKRGYATYNYQMDAIKLALSIIKNYNGVIIADVVGLGKTIIACAVAYLLRKRGIVICPPGLMGDSIKKSSGWYKYLEDFKLREWEVFSSGKLEDPLEFVQNDTDIEVVIIDEAHRYRNQDTESYELLKNICNDKKVILLTATPFNNTPSDIFSLLKLFTIPKLSGLTLRDNLHSEFREYESMFKKLSYIQKYHNSDQKDKRKNVEKFYLQLFGPDAKTIDIKAVKNRAHQLAKRIRSVIQPVLIRRNRLDLQQDPDYKDEVKHLSRVNDPIELFYELTEEQSKFYDEVITKYFCKGGRFTGAIYRPYYYEKGSQISEEEFYDEENGNDKKNHKRKEEQQEQISQQNLYDFMRRLLVKRFESSFGAFYESVNNFIKTHTIVLEFIRKTNQYILNRNLLEKIYELEPDEIIEKMNEFFDSLEEIESKKKDSRRYKIYDLDDFLLKEEFIADIQKDIQLFEEIKSQIEQLDLLNNDPKSVALAQKIPGILHEKKEEEPLRKVVVFTEYIDTAEHLKRKLEQLLPVELKQKILLVTDTLSVGRYETLLANFDASYAENKQKNDYVILITTDRLSEGFNLNRAGAVINYDIPWNPTRVIQRVGRINRIGKKVFEQLYIYNFFPTQKGEDQTNSKLIAQQKMFLIHNTLGEDAKIFDPDEEPQPSELYNKLTKLPSEEMEESIYTSIKLRLKEIEEKHKEVMDKIKYLPGRVKTAKPFDGYNLLVFIRKGRNVFVKFKDDKSEDSVEITFEEALPYIECEYDTPRLSFSPHFWENYKQLVKSPKGELAKNKVSRKWEEAINNMRYICDNLPSELDAYKDFLLLLLKDLTDYHTLSDKTVDRIRRLELDPKNNYERFKEQIDKLQKLMGRDYIRLIKSGNIFKQELIIAVENNPIQHP